MMAMVLALFMFSLIGIPPLAGFWGKYRLVLGALSVEGSQSSSTGGWLLFLAIVLVLNAAISAGYYLRIIGTMYFAERDQPLASGGLLGPRVAAIASALLVIVLGIAPDTFWMATDRAAGQPLAAYDLSTGIELAASRRLEQAERSGFGKSANDAVAPLGHDALHQQ